MCYNFLETISVSKNVIPKEEENFQPGGNKMASLAEKLEIIHAQGKEAFRRLEDREEYNAFYTACLLIAEVDPETESPKIELLIRSEAYKDMGTEDPEDDEYLPLHEEHIPFSNLTEFNALIDTLIEMYGAENIYPVIPDFYVIHEGFPTEYSIENLKELLSDTKASGDWSMGGGFGICVYDEY